LQQANGRGFLFGFGLGWLPSGILAIIVFYVAAYLYPGIILLGLWLVLTGTHFWDFMHELLL
jgi:hypothetical protein